MEVSCGVEAWRGEGCGTADPSQRGRYAGIGLAVGNRRHGWGEAPLGQVGNGRRGLGVECWEGNGDARCRWGRRVTIWNNGGRM